MVFIEEIRIPIQSGSDDVLRRMRRGYMWNYVAGKKFKYYLNLLTL
jgi:tRNA A37 methylthiotransferase MiaB